MSGGTAEALEAFAPMEEDIPTGTNAFSDAKEEEEDKDKEKNMGSRK